MHDDTTPPPPGRRGMRPSLGLALAGTLFACTVGVLIYKNVYPGPGVAATPGASPPDRSQADPASVNSSQIDRIDDEFDLAGLTLDRALIISPSPNKDDIPSLTTAAARGDGYAPPGQSRPPAIVSVDDEHGIPLDTKVIGVTINGRSRAYPHTVLDRHECVNDLLGGVPVAVTYCPLCDSATVFDRRMGEGDDAVTLEFGVSGLLYHSNVLLYDRTHQALWSQVLLTAVSGPFAGQPLRYLAGWEITTLGDWAQRHPDGTVVGYDTGLTRYRPHGYSARAYASYFASDNLMFPVADQDDRLPRKTPVIGVVAGGSARAYHVAAIDGTWTDRFPDGGTLTLRGDGAGGVHVVAMPDGARVTHSFWYAWYAFHPETTLVTEQPG